MKRLMTCVTIAAGVLTLAAGAAVADPAGDPNGAPAPAAARGHHPRALAEALKVAADTIGVSTDELREAVQGGQTVAQVAQSKGVDPQRVIDAIVAAATQKIDQALADGKIDEPRAAELKRKLPQIADRLVNQTRQLVRRAERRSRRKAAIETAAKAIGISTDELVDAVKSGRSIADVADSKGVEVSKVVGALVAEATKRIAEAVDAGRLPAAEGDQLKSRLADRIDTFLHRTFGQRADANRGGAGTPAAS